MKKTVAVIGLGTFGVELVGTLKKLGAEVIAVDKSAAKLQLVGDVADRCFVCDSANVKSLVEAGIDKIDHAIIALGQGTSSLLVTSITTTLNLKKLGVKEIVVRLDSEEYEDILKEVGATMLFSPLKMASERLSNIVVAENYEDYFNISDNYSVLQIEVSNKFKEITLEKLNAPRKYGVIVLLIRRANKIFMPTKDDVIQPDDNVYAFGSMEKVEQLAKFLSK